jgi:hypothetical protein
MTNLLRSAAIVAAITCVPAGFLAAADGPRMAGLIDGDGGDFVLTRARGILDVSHPQIGQYCIKPRKQLLIDVTRDLPILTVDAATTNAGAGAVAQFRSSGSGCPAGHFAVVTSVQSADGVSSDPSDDIGFVFVVP